jgi:hypothetical protein
MMLSEGVVERRTPWAAVLLVGAGLWLFLRAGAGVLAAIPGLGEGASLWTRTVSSAAAPVVEAVLAVALVGVLLLIHRFERVDSVRGAVRAGVLLSLPPMAAALALGEQVGAPAYGALRGVLVGCGVICASVLLVRLVHGRRR